MQNLSFFRHHRHQDTQQTVQTGTTVDTSVNSYVDTLLSDPTVPQQQPIYTIADTYVRPEPLPVTSALDDDIYHLYDAYDNVYPDATVYPDTTIPVRVDEGYDMVAPGTTTTQAGGNYILGTSPVNTRYAKIDNVQDANLTVKANNLAKTQVDSVVNNGEISFKLVMLI